MPIGKKPNAGSTVNDVVMIDQKRFLFYLFAWKITLVDSVIY